MVKFGHVSLALRDGTPQLLPHQHQRPKLTLQVIQHLDSPAGGKLQAQQFIVALLDLLHVLLVFNLKLVEVYQMEHLPHLLLVCQLLLHFGNIGLSCSVFQAQLLNHSVLLPQLFLHKLYHFLSHNLPRAWVLRANDDVPLELIGIFFGFCDAHVHLFHERSDVIHVLVTCLLQLVNLCLDELHLLANQIVLLVIIQLLKRVFALDFNLAFPVALFLLNAVLLHGNPNFNEVHLSEVGLQ
mmetsp:Transcript_21790/g.60395  ORF Transcript_21790/g.60395 Transcript_21790/m.60395 type:complete len:240 (-) Transcript_21790:261-980(-)